MSLGQRLIDLPNGLAVELPIELLQDEVSEDDLLVIADCDDAVLGAVRQMIVDVVGEDYLLDLEIEMHTTFDRDLELESIEFVALAERLHEAYGDRVDFVAWIADKELDEIIGMTVGELVRHIATCLESPS